MARKYVLRKVVIALIGVQLDQRGTGEERWKRLRPKVSLVQHEDVVWDSDGDYNGKGASPYGKLSELFLCYFCVNLHCINHCYFIDCFPRISKNSDSGRDFTLPSRDKNM